MELDDTTLWGRRGSRRTDVINLCLYIPRTRLVQKFEFFRVDMPRQSKLFYLKNKTALLLLIHLRSGELVAVKN